MKYENFNELCEQFREENIKNLPELEQTQLTIIAKMELLTLKAELTCAVAEHDMIEAEKIKKKINSRMLLLNSLHCDTVYYPYANQHIPLKDKE